MPNNSDAPRLFLVTRDGGAGLTRRQTQSSRFTSPTRGLRLITEAAQDRSALTAGLAAVRPDAVVTDLAAAVAWELPLPFWAEATARPTSIAVSPGRAQPRRASARGRRLDLPDGHVTDLRGLRLTTPARTWLDCAEPLPFAHVVAMGDAVLHRNLSTTDELAQLCQWAFRRRGVVKARRALPLLEAGAESPGESLARVALITGGVPRPLCNANIWVDGEWLARVDMLWPTARVIVEYDGIVHLPEAQRRKDALRRNLLQAAGYYVIVLTADDLRQPERMCMTVKTALAARSPR